MAEEKDLLKQIEDELFNPDKEQSGDFYYWHKFVDWYNDKYAPTSLLFGEDYIEDNIEAEDVSQFIQYLIDREEVI